MIKECLPKVGIKLLKISYVRILFLVSLFFVAAINPYSVFLNFQLLNILVIISYRQKKCSQFLHILYNYRSFFIRKLVLTSTTVYYATLMNIVGY